MILKTVRNQLVVWALAVAAHHDQVQRVVAQELTPAPATPTIYQPPIGYGQFLGDEFPTPLPPVDSDVQPPTRLASFPSMMTEPLLGDPNNPVLLPPVEQPKKPPGREGFFQRATFTTTYLPRLDGTGVGFLGVDTNLIFGLPCPTRESPLLIRPGTEVNFVEASTAFDLPSELYDNYMEFRWLSKITPRFGVDISVTPGWHSDYQNSIGADCYRTVAYGVGAWDWTPQLTLAAGIIYLDRDDVNLAPAGGIIWTPNDDTRFELISPRPRIARRFHAEPTFADWMYVAGEFGGGQWGIQQAGGVNNVLTSSDWRLLLGIERKSNNLGLNGRIEIGYVFGRVLRFRDNLPDQDLPDTMLARVGVWY
ncbi:MAG: hypothetical protein IT427_01620 [Pirellulales bacterium]|nr:hypothetical protein [Pirellulales bacterium]